MNRHAIYMSNGQGPDVAIHRGLVAAGCEVFNTHNVAETFGYLVKLKDRPPVASESEHTTSPVLVAEIQAGAIALLRMIRECGYELPPTLIFDREGVIPAAITALKLGVSGYMLATDSEIDREVGTWVIAGLPETSKNRPAKVTIDLPVPQRKPARKSQWVWMPAEHMIMKGSDYLRLSPTETIIFDTLYNSRGQVVSSTAIIERALGVSMGMEKAIRLLRPHMMRLRRKVYSCANWLSLRITNVRGTGYVLT
jgi:DNA-binding response OmpR family regulator